MDNRQVLPLEQLWAVLQGSFAGGLPLPYIQEIFLLECHIAGTSYVDIDKIEPDLKRGDLLAFRREPENEHDPLAIMILEQRGRKLGYIPRAKNEVLARLMDAGKLVFGKIEGLERFDKWLKITIRVYMKDL